MARTVVVVGSWTSGGDSGNNVHISPQQPVDIAACAEESREKYKTIKLVIRAMRIKRCYYYNIPRHTIGEDLSQPREPDKKKIYIDDI